jgi:hypothetical protein
MRAINYEKRDNKSNKIYNLNQITLIEISLYYFKPNYISFYPNIYYPFLKINYYRLFLL